MQFIVDSGNSTTNESSTQHAFMPILSSSPVASSAMVAAPLLLGSIIRIPVAMLTERYSTRILHLAVMVVSFIGILGLTILSFATQNMGELGLGIYWAYLLFGAIGGTGNVVI